MSTALYRRYRSARFGDLIGQPTIIATLLNQMRTGRVPHAYLFTGVRGTGKTSTARIVARAVNCLQSADGEPCNICPPCLEIGSGSAVDVLEIDAASNRGIDDVRELRERVNYLPASLRRKVYIIDEAHMLTTDAWNAFLKTLEEPPSHVLFILATTEPHKIPDTVRSRTQRFDFRRVAVDDLAGHLARISDLENGVLEPEAGNLIARAAHGSVRDALSLLDRVLAVGDGALSAATVRRALGLADPAIVRDILTALGHGDPAATLRGITAAFDAGVDAQQLLREAARLARAAALGAIGLTPATSADRDEAVAARTLAETAPSWFWVGALEMFASTEANLKQVADARLQVELCMLRLVCPAEREDATAGLMALTARVQALERASGHERPNRAGPSTPVAAAVPGAASPPVAVEPSAGHVTSEAEVPVDPGPAPGLAPTDLAAWTAAWPRFVDAMNRRDFMLAGLLKDCRPIEASSGGLVIGALHQFHLEQIQTKPKPALLAEVATEIAGRSITVETVFSGQAMRAEAATKVAEATRAALDTFRGSRFIGSRPREPRAADPTPEEPGS